MLRVHLEARVPPNCLSVGTSRGVVWGSGRFDDSPAKAPRAGKPGGVLGSLDSGQKDPMSYVNIVHSFSGREAAKADLCLVTWQLCLFCAVNETSFSF